MQINLKESLIRVCEVPGELHREGKKLHTSTAMRWCLKGVRGHRLESLMVGGVRYTSREALGRFLGALNAPHEADHAADVTRDRRVEAVDAALDAEGF